MECLPPKTLNTDIAGVLVEAYSGESAWSMEPVEKVWQVSDDLSPRVKF